MRKHYLSIAIIATMALASCSTEGDDVIVQPAENEPADITIPDKKELISFKAVHSNGISKTAIENRIHLVFSAEEDISVFDGTSTSVFTGDNTSGNSATCNFTGTANANAETYYAVYPKTANLDASSASGVIPAEQNAVAESFDPNAHLMVASASGADKEFKFNTANAFIRFTAPRNLTSVVMTGNNGENIAGDITVSGYSNLSVSGGTEQSITLTGEMQRGKEYYISYIPTSFASGIKLTYTDKLGNEVSYTTGNFSSKPNQVNNIKEEKLCKPFFVDCSVSDLENASTNPLNKLNSSKEVGMLSFTDYKLNSAVKSYINKYSGEVRLILSNNDNTYILPGINDDAFFGCSRLLSVEIPSTVTYIGMRAFTGCIALDIPSLPAGITEIKKSAFSNCGNLSLTSLPENLITIGDNAFLNCSKLAVTSIPDGVTSIGSYAFQNCTSLKEITIPASISELYDDVFIGCTSLKSITFLGNTSLDDKAYGKQDDFNDCPAGTKIYITEAMYKRSSSYTDYWNTWNAKDNITVYVDGNPLP